MVNRTGGGRRWRATMAAVLPAFLLAMTVGGRTPAAARGAVAAGAGDRPLRLPQDRAVVAPDFSEIDTLLRQRQWTAAETQLRAGEKRLIVGPGGRAEWLARLALAEAGSGQGDRSLWHWAVANALATGLFSSQELGAFGDAGALLAGRPGRQAGKAPLGMTVEAAGPEVEKEVKTQGELPELARGVWSQRQWLRLEVVVDEQGRVRDPVVLAARSDEAAYRVLEAVRDWRFEPARKRGQPVATLHTLVINPPGLLALDKVIKLSQETRAIEGRLRRQQWKQAADAAERHWYALLDSTDPGHGQEAERAALGMTMALWTLARAGLDPKEQAWTRCRWEAAQSLMPTLYDLDLSPYGPAGQTLAAWRAEEYDAPFQPRLRADKPPGDVAKPEKIQARVPYYPSGAKKLGLSGKVILASIIDAAGRVREPVILVPEQAGDQVPFAASAVDTVCDWRFKPATLDGRPVKVYYTLTVSFEARWH